MSKRSNLIQIIIFIAFIATFLVILIALPDKSFSQKENRVLQTNPQFSFSALFGGDYTSHFETYITDQFPMRDTWVVLKAGSETAVGKQENNGIYLCKDGILIEPYTAPQSSKLDSRLGAINSFAMSQEIPVYFALIPSAAELWRDVLPTNAPNDSQKEIIDYTYSLSDCINIDVYTVLENHTSEYIYFHTDHHWTALGAYYGYTAIMDAMGLDYSDLSSYTPKVVSDSFYGTAHSSSGYCWVDPDRLETYVPAGSETVINYASGSAQESKIYDKAFLEVKDKYSYFFGGNTPLIQITTENADAPSLLIIRDSYMDALSPFLLENFSAIHIIDLRYYKLSLAEYITENEIDSALICYSVKNFAKDDNIFLISR